MEITNATNVVGVVAQTRTGRFRPRMVGAEQHSRNCGLAFRLSRASKFLKYNTPAEQIPFTVTTSVARSSKPLVDASLENQGSSFERNDTVSVRPAVRRS
jgi:hypothetical protein